MRRGGRQSGAFICAEMLFDCWISGANVCWLCLCLVGLGEWRCDCGMIVARQRAVLSAAGL